ncbi:MAG TPA: hypothetical protein VMD99_15800 [Terriglobales bacterium]|nr:hypothetical protein [Terriglobales bacterium]
MKRKLFRTSLRLFFFVFAASLSLPFASLAQTTGTPRVSGSYQVVQKIEVGRDTRVELKLHLMNHESRDLHIERLALRGVSHSAKGGSQVCSIVVGAQTFADTTQQFTVRREEYELWKRGARPRLVLELQRQNGRGASEVVRLDRISSGREN